MTLDPLTSVVMLATTPERRRLETAESFCLAVEGLASVIGLVRLHPSEGLSTYAEIAKRHPRVRFTTNSESSLDESLAAADIVVVSISGLGSDALIKRKPVVVLSEESAQSGHDWDLVEQAGCPRAQTPGELAHVLSRMLSDKAFREQSQCRAESYVAQLCGAFGQESARQIATFAREQVERSSMAGVKRTGSLTEVSNG